MMCAVCAVWCGVFVCGVYVVNDTDRHGSEHFEKILVLFLITLNFLKLQDRVENIYLMISIYVKSLQKKKKTTGQR